MIRAYLVALDPTDTQSQALRSHCGAQRYAYNFTNPPASWPGASRPGSPAFARPPCRSNAAGGTCPSRRNYPTQCWHSAPATG
ncbi:MAG: hypothetical protein DLM61_22185 [Pseudonocardiales bacterium]|nr:helix-turn-helix domain-containing protein [Pseudonocardiales bacterium]PZS24456.1 MAG: hypothetical protein DLM61_22185 [Pseudonocardiales bacterium]